MHFNEAKVERFPQQKLPTSCVFSREYVFFICCNSKNREVFGIIARSETADNDPRVGVVLTDFRASRLSLEKLLIVKLDPEEHRKTTIIRSIVLRTDCSKVGRVILKKIFHLQTWNYRKVYDSSPLANKPAYIIYARADHKWDFVLHNISSRHIVEKPTYR